VISLDVFRDKLCSLFKKQFPDAEISINERRSAILEIRIFFTSEVFMESYVNGITGKKSFALVEKGKRIWGYDNYRYFIGIGITTQLKSPKIIYRATSHHSKRLWMRCIEYSPDTTITYELLNTRDMQLNKPSQFARRS
jgi:hypothetical protein